MEPYEETRDTGDGHITPAGADYQPQRAIEDDTTTATTEEATQVQYPWRATVRTILAYLLAAGLVVPIAWGIVVDELAEHGLVLPDGAVQVVGYLLAVLAVVTGAITRIMAIPQVAAWMTRLGAGPAPKED